MAKLNTKYQKLITKTLDYLKYHIQQKEIGPELLLALLEQLAFESFEEAPNGWYAYLPIDQQTPSIEEDLAQLEKNNSVTYTKEVIPTTNWNAQWEASFQPLLVDNFCCIRADFHPQSADCTYDIIINPKMAFGTGHHETTYMMIQLMQGINFKGKKVFDFGCGTGILAILAEKMGAVEIIAIDNEGPAVENTLENINKNGALAINISEGTLDSVTDNDFDFVLANINRKVILDSLTSLYEQTKPNAQLLLSGILASDQNLIEEKLTTANFNVQQRTQKGEWLAYRINK